MDIQKARVFLMHASSLLKLLRSYCFNSKIYKDVIIGPNCEIGKRVYIGDRVQIDNDVTIEDGSKIRNGAYIKERAIVKGVVGKGVIIEREEYYARR